jgi:DNA-binding PadR family transcriptional regulator
MVNAMAICLNPIKEVARIATHSAYSDTQKIAACVLQCQAHFTFYPLDIAKHLYYYILSIDYRRIFLKIPYYLLGFLIRFGRQHGYSLKETISREVADFAKIKLPTIYYNLEKLRDQGYVTAMIEKEGNRPEKTVYEITDSGRQYFGRLTGEILKEHYEPEFILDAVLYFLDLADMETVTLSLQKRAEILDTSIRLTQRHHEAVLSSIPTDAAFLAESIFSHHLSHMQIELKWTQSVLKGLQP